MAIALFAFLAMVGGFLTFHEAKLQADAAFLANQMNAEGGRAWISPNDIFFGNGVNPDEPFFVDVIFNNSGRAPSIQTTEADNTSLVQIPVDWKHGVVWDNPTINMCQDADRSSRNIVVFPSQDEREKTLSGGGPSQKVFYWSSDRPFREIRRNSNAVVDLQSGMYFVMYNFCFAYGAKSDRHYTRACYYLEPDLLKPVRRWQFFNCTNGNDAS